MQLPAVDRATAIHVTKYDGSYHRHFPVRWLRSEGALHVFDYTRGTPISRTRDPRDDPSPFIEPSGGEVWLFDDRWYNVQYANREARTLYYTNIASPATFDGREFHYVDFDLDVWWWADAEPELLDEDEFLAHSEAMRYPADVIQNARAAVDEVLGLIRQRAFPFHRP